MRMKTCALCKEEKEISSFPIHQRRNGKPDYEARCHPCHRKHYNAYLARHLAKHPDIHEQRKKKSRDWHHKNTERILNLRMKWSYQLSSADFNSMLSKQNGVCAICGGTNKSGRRLFVDHNHETGSIRGLLCMLCNSGIGRFRDSQELLEKALAYLRERR